MAARRDVDVGTLECVLVKRLGRQFLCWFLCCAADEQKNPRSVATLVGGYALMAPHGAIVGVRCRYSAASTVATMRRLLRASSSYFSCHSVGPFEGVTWTAVTLYSGQLVAQSEYSVVTTLACVFG